MRPHLAGTVVTVYDVLGREVAVVVGGRARLGPLAPGVYLERAEADGTARAARFSVVR